MSAKMDYRDIAELVREARHERDEAMGKLLAAGWHWLANRTRKGVLAAEMSLQHRFHVGHPAGGH